LQARWTEFLGHAVPFLTKIAGAIITGGPSALAARDSELAADARRSMELLGPTYIKVGQMMSVRPDVIGPNAMAELAKLQDSVPRFSSVKAFAMIESELGRSIDDVFSELSPEPVAAASLAQVYKGTLRACGTAVAVKVQRPGVRGVVSKDLYVLRRAAEVYQGLMERLAPSQRTDYVALLNEWAIGFYTELDFNNEAANAIAMKEALATRVPDVYIPAVFTEVSSRRVLVTEWVDGVKLTTCPPEEIASLTALGQEAFLTQLLSLGFFHADPHPGNMLAMADTTKGRLALIDFGLVARLSQDDQDALVASIVHLANKDYTSLIDDFIKLNILPADTPRATVEPLMARVLGPYVAGGGGLSGAISAYGGASGVQSLTSDILTALSSVPFSIPPYFALLARAVAVLEGIALAGDPNYRIVMATYPFVARKLLSDDAPALQKSLSEILYARGDGEDADGTRALRGRRLAALLSAALGGVVREGAFVDFDALPEEGLPPAQVLHLLLSPRAQALRDGVLAREATGAADLLARQALRRALRPLTAAAEAPPPSGLFALLPRPPPPRVPLPRAGGGIAWLEPGAFVDAVAPRLSQAEELFAQSLSDAASALLGVDADALAAGWLPLSLQPGPGGLPLPTLAPLPRGLSVDAAAATVALVARAAAEAGLPGARAPQAAAAASALEAAVRAAAGAAPQAPPQAHAAAGDAPADIARALAALPADEAAVLSGLLQNVRDAVAERFNARVAALAAVA
jgi:predicted unusual protein kinase regulating ubiquinone biosynthesis (AarF/ABC1/UbiB family)